MIQRPLFNLINRKVWLRNLRILCPEIATLGTNLYSIPARLFVQGGAEISSDEGTTQGCPFSMPGYAIGILPLMSLIGLNEECIGVKQAAFADDLTGVGKLKQLKIWWNMILEYGPYIGYHAKPSKSWLIVKKEKLEEAKIMFKNTGLNITSEGRKHLGAAVGSEAFKESYVKKKIEN